MKGLIIYKGVYGATKQYAQWIADETNLPEMPSYECSREDIVNSDFLIIGSSVYMGRLSIKEWLKVNFDILSGKKIVLFVVCGTPAQEREKLESHIESSVPGKLREQCAIYFLPGRLNYKKLSWSDKFMLRIGAIFTGNAKEKNKMINGYDLVKKENLNQLIKGVKMPVNIPSMIPAA